MNSQVLTDEMLRFGRLLHYAGIAAALVCAAAGYAWLYTPVEQNIFDLTLRIDELAQSKQNADAIRREHERLSGRLQDIADRYAALQQCVPENAEAGKFLRNVSDIAREENLTIGNFQPAKSVEGDGFTTMEVMLDGRGNFKSVCSFFDRLSKLKRLSKVKDLSVSVDPRSDDYPMKAMIVIYFGLRGDQTESSKKEVNRG